MLQQRHFRMMIFAGVFLLVSASAQAQLAYTGTQRSWCRAKIHLRNT